MAMFRLQPAPFTDQLTGDGHQLTKLPYPFYADEFGAVGRQDFWRGDPSRVVGFQKDLYVQRIDLWWTDAVKNPEAAVGMYLVTEDSRGNYGTHQTAMAAVERMDEGTAAES
jgi:hypothetical protein